MEGSSLSPFLAVRGNVDSTWTRAPQSPSALSASSHLLAPADASGDLAGVRRQSARRASPSAPRNPSQDTSLLPQARGCFPKFFLPPEQGRRPSTSAVCPAAPPLPSPPSLRVLAPAPLRLSRAPSAPGTAAKAAEPAKTDPEKAYSPRPWKWRLQRPGPQAPATSALAAVISACFVQRHFQMHPGQPAMLLHIHPQTAQRR